MDLLADLEINVHRKAHLLRIEVSGAINVRDRDRDYLYFPSVYLSLLAVDNL